MNKTTMAVLATLLFAVSASAQNYYEIRDLGVLPGQTSSMATDINNKGVVTGKSGLRSFIYRDCKMTDLGSLGGWETSAEDMNENSMIVGFSRARDGSKRAFAWENGSMTDLGGTLEEAATAVSSWGIPVGVESVAGLSGGNGVFYFNNKAIMLPKYVVNPPYGWGYMERVSDVNNAMQVTGWLQVSGTAIGLVSGGGFTGWYPIQGIRGLNPSVFPFGINDNGHVVGGAGFGITHAFLSTDPAQPARDLGTLGGDQSVAYDINNSGWIVGWSDRDGTSGPLAFVHNGSQMIDLNMTLINGAGWQLREATAINDNGAIVGNGSYNGQLHAFMLIPRLNPWLPVSICRLPPIFTSDRTIDVR